MSTDANHLPTGSQEVSGALWTPSSWTASDVPPNTSASLPEQPGEEEWGGNVGEIAGMVVIQFIYALVCLLGLVGNSLVIFVILRYAKMKTATNIYLLNLAIADELFMLSIPFVATSAALHHWPFGRALCRTVLGVDGLNMFTSVFCLTVLSLDRYIAVVHPLRAATYRRPRVAKMVNGGVWLLSLLVASPIPIFAGTATTRDGHAVACNLLWPSPAWSAAFVVYTTLLGFLLPVLAMGLCYLLIVGKMRAVAQRVGWQQRRRTEGKLTRLVLIIVAMFVVCWMPFYVVQLVNLLLPGRLDATVNNASLILSYSNSCANPILYGFLSENFRHSFQGVLRRCFDASFCCCPVDLDEAEEEEEEPLDYCANPRGDEKNKGCMCPTLPCQQEPVHPEPCCKPGTLLTKTTTF
ncbi:somatostatin receptor type 4 [Alligator mississippiensis]|uniref:Somatostatin receptor type 4 n=2 Tax=Alligator TaxID=8495 RepID=A0A151NDX2_ALLMI|nr:somatostatin receptor type 4 [Alligator sinensis]XP_019346545.1 somatostatin receptor type 4 [Alligator mississippiensis]KYO34735.1 somatostatin receptor type 4 [Alligator mississippiensis]